MIEDETDMVDPGMLLAFLDLSPNFYGKGKWSERRIAYAVKDELYENMPNAGLDHEYYGNAAVLVDYTYCREME